jgi:hypothetical protein
MAVEEAQEVEFAGGRVDLVAADQDAAAGHVELDDAEAVGLGTGLAAAATAQRGANAGDDLGHREGLGDVVVGAQGEAEHLVALLVLGRKDDHRRIGIVGAHALDDLDAVELGQHHVEQDEVGLVRAEQLERLLAVVGADGAEALEPQVHLQPLQDRRVVLDDEHAIGHG